MRIRSHAQRTHIIDSLEVLLFQLHVLSFLQAPSLLGLVTRCASQLQLSKPRDADPRRTLRFWFFLILLFNFGSLWTHAAQGAPEGRGVVLDFIGMAYRPGRAQLIFLDCVIVFLSLLITTLAYETSYTLASPSSGTLPGANTDPATTTAAAAAIGTDPLQPLAAHSHPATPPDPALAPCAAAAATITAGTGAEALVVDVRLAAVTRHLRDPPPPPPPARAGGGALLPLPSAAGWPLSESLRMLMRARNAGARGAAPAVAVGGEQGGQGQGGQGQGRGQGRALEDAGAGDGSRRLPGSIDPDDGG